MKKKAVLIKEVLETLIKEYEPQRESAQEKILKHWEIIVTPQAQQHCRPALIKNGTLLIIVSNSAWLHELTVKKNEILEKIKNITKEVSIKDIRLKIGK
ncbi:MAG: DUF721 domain-containing protein [Candidatus Omnitrophica bacterium]|nr:DUF721 domain-containing protein [Candidatus Omnitrophota bacterium]